jgi:N-carbamoylputrescine amidase
MSSLTIALLQLTSCADDIALNQAKGERYCRQAADMGADVALFPEMWSNGYRSFAAPDGVWGDFYRSPEIWARDSRPAPPIDAAAYQRWADGAVDEGGADVTAFCELARELNMAIAVTYTRSGVSRAPAPCWSAR